MAAILNSAMLDSATAILDSDTLLSCLRFTQKHSPSNLTLTQTNSFCLKLIHFHLIDFGSHLEFCHIRFTHCNVGFRHLVIFSHIHSKHLPLLWLWLKLIHSDSNSFILTELDDDSHLEFFQLCFSHLAQKTSLIHSDLTWWWQPSWILPS